jgi:tetratricopeptide (TPR) repeat protein
MWMGRFEEALERIRMAQQLDPLSPMVYGNEGELLMHARRYDEAIQFFQTARERKLDFFNTRTLTAAAYLGKRMYDSAISELGTALRMGGGPIVNARLAHVYAVSGRRREAVAILADLLEPRKAPHVSDYGIAVAYAGFGETDRAMARLTNEFHARSRTMVYLGQDPYLDPIRKDPRFRDLVRRVGLFE